MKRPKTKAAEAALKIAAAIAPPKAGATGKPASRLIDQRIRDLGEWHGEALARMRSLILEADPEMTEEWKWMGTPVWSHHGIVCTGEAYTKVVKLTFARGARIPDPSRLFNSSLEGNTRRAIDIHEGEKVDEGAFKALVKAAVALNGPSPGSGTYSLVRWPMRAFSAAGLLALALTAAADGLVKYKDWADSPQAYFLSKAERTKWATISTDADAEKFIAEYQAARGKGFAAAIQSRIDAADKTYADLRPKGARSPVGKTLILLGPPTTTERSGSSEKKEKSDAAGTDAVNQGGGGGRGSAGGVENPTTNTGSPGASTLRNMSAPEPVYIRWVYKGAGVPQGVGASEVTIEFLDEPGKLSFKDKDKADALFEKVVEYWAPKPK